MATKKKLPILITTDLQTDNDSVKRTRAVNTAALSLARKLETSLEMVHVAHLGETEWIPQATQAILETQKGSLQNLVNPFREITRAHFLTGHPVTMISKLTSRRGRYEMLAQGTSGRTGLRRALLGSVAEEVIRASKIPVLTVGPEAQKLSREHSLESSPAPLIVLAADLTPNTGPAEIFAQKLARRIGGEVLAIHHLEAGLHPLLQTAMSTPSGSRELSEFVAEIRKDSEKQLAKMEARFRKARVPFRSKLLTRQGNSADSLIEEVRNSGANLVVMGTHSRNLMTAAFLGSTARGVILGSPAPVITVRR